MSFPIGPLTAIAIADAYGCGFEFLPTFDKEWGMDYKQHTMAPHMGAGCFSDDTIYTAALAQAIVDDRLYKDYLVEAWLRNPARGGSPNMRKLMESTYLTGKFEPGVQGDSAGAAMRATIFGLWPEIKQVMEFVKYQAELTHGGDGVLAAKATALMVYFMREGSSCGSLRSKLYQELKDERFNPSNRPVKPKRPGNKGMECVLTALWFVENCRSFAQLLRGIIDLGGDTDTVGVIAMGTVWLSLEYKHDLPLNMWTGLEDGPYGRTYLRELELKLLRKLCPQLKLRCD